MAVAEQERPIVGKKRGRPKSKDPRGDGLQVRLSPDVVRMARVMAPIRGATLSDYLSNILRPVVVREYTAAMRLTAKEGAE
jgi:hypothetical protein